MAGHQTGYNEPAGQAWRISFFKRDATFDEHMHLLQLLLQTRS
jgi:hypothetical protein